MIEVKVKGLEEVDQMVRRIKEYKKNIEKSPSDSLDDLLEKGKELMSGMVDSSSVATSIDTEKFNDNEGSIFTEHPIAKYLEYGTGIIGSLYPHPKLPPGWSYDVNEHGWAGWTYPKPGGGYGRTSGQPGQRFVLDTAFLLRKQARVEVLNKLKEYKL